jgi:hypothetical protein
LSPRFAHMYFMKDEPDRVRAVVGRHVAHWQEVQLPRLPLWPLPGPDWGTDHVRGRGREQARRAVDTDPFVREGLLEAHWRKQWTPE